MDDIPTRPALGGQVRTASSFLQVDQLRKLYPVRTGGGTFASRKKKSFLHAVDGVSFQIARGESLGLVGESGSGKSTLAQIITRLLEPTGGAVRFEGADITAVSCKDFTHAPQRSQIQMIFQDAGEAINPRFTAFQAIAHPLRRLKGLDGGALEAKVKQAADRVSFAVDLLGRFPHQLSGGQKARVGIARAIALEPDLLVLDEPTSALDASVQAVILKLLDGLRKELGLSYLFVSHDLNVVHLLCDRVAVMYLGKVVEEGSVTAVFENPEHPYTASLLASMPGGKRAGRRVFKALSAEPRSPIDPSPSVCRFFGRCPRGQMNPCATIQPELSPTAGGSKVACHFPLTPTPTFSQ